ncbi:hypothetical protein [Gehongia tenuis]|uniref:Uncharacterized protein n=1 Tax=Gehongia tenuis TaxID=2763655 RepID=A0A926D2Z8_9FIRM|nr:hypothetical protein [Gehongia tenuis]MBC8530581.1 hypothetical protein [Gehongia tenuis]
MAVKTDWAASEVVTAADFNDLSAKALAVDTHTHNGTNGVKLDYGNLTNTPDCIVKSGDQTVEGALTLDNLLLTLSGAESSTAAFSGSALTLLSQVSAYSYGEGRIGLKAGELPSGAASSGAADLTALLALLIEAVKELGGAQ